MNDLAYIINSPREGLFLLQTTLRLSTPTMLHGVKIASFSFFAASLAWVLTNSLIRSISGSGCRVQPIFRLFIFMSHVWLMKHGSTVQRDRDSLAIRPGSRTCFKVYSSLRIVWRKASFRVDWVAFIHLLHSWSWKADQRVRIVIPPYPSKRRDPLTDPKQRVHVNRRLTYVTKASKCSPSEFDCFTSSSIGFDKCCGGGPILGPPLFYSSKLTIFNQDFTEYLFSIVLHCSSADSCRVTSCHSLPRLPLFYNQPDAQWQSNHQSTLA